MMYKDYLALLRKHKESNKHTLVSGRALNDSTSSGGSEVDIYLYDTIHSSASEEALYGGVSAERLVKEIDSAQTDITLHINSPGGSVSGGMAVYNSLKSKQGKSKAIVEGIAASAAAVVMMGASEIVAHEASLMMVHKAWGVTVGNADDHREQVEVLDKIDSLLHSIISDRTGASADVVDGWLSKDTFFTAKEALEIGLIDSIVNNDERVFQQDALSNHLDGSTPEMVELYQRFKKLCPKT